MTPEGPTVADIFRRAQAIRKETPQTSYKEIKAQLAREYAGQPMPPLYNLTIPEQDARAPEEDWSAGLSLVRRGIQFQDWKEIASGIVLSLEQTENYESQRGAEGIERRLARSLSRSRGCHCQRRRQMDARRVDEAG